MSNRKNPPWRRVRHAVAAATVVTIGVAAPALAAPVAGCPSSAADWELRSVEDITLAIAGPDDDLYDALLPGIQAIDRNGDDELCLAMRWGDHLNPKSHWYRLGMELIGQPFDLFIPVDNVASAR